MNKNTLALDGTACCMKTSILRKFEKDGYRCKYMDFKENVDIYPDFIHKTKRSKLSYMYTIHQMTQLQYDSDVDFIDRSPLSDLWYFIIFEIFNQMKEDGGENEQLYKELANAELSKFMYTQSEFEDIEKNNTPACPIRYNLHKNFFTKCQTLLFIPDVSHTNEILTEMTNRSNGLDILDSDFVRAQIIFFNVLYDDFKLPNIHAYRFKDGKLFTNKQLDDITSFTINLKNKITNKERQRMTQWIKVPILAGFIWLLSPLCSYLL